MATSALQTKDFETTLNRPGIVIYDLWAPWCGPCRVFGPTFEKVSEKHLDIAFMKVNTDAEPAIAQAFGVRGIPTLVVFRDGVPLFMQAGVLPEAALEELIAKVRALDMVKVRAEIAAADTADAASR